MTWSKAAKNCYAAVHVSEPGAVLMATLPGGQKGYHHESPLALGAPSVCLEASSGWDATFWRSNTYSNAGIQPPWISSRIYGTINMDTGLCYLYLMGLHEIQPRISSRKSSNFDVNVSSLTCRSKSGVSESLRRTSHLEGYGIAPLRRALQLASS